MTVALCLAAGLMTSDLRATDIAGHYHPPLLGVAITCNWITQRSANPLLLGLPSQSRDGKQINLIRKHFGGRSSLKKGTEKGTENGEKGRAKDRTAGERESGKEGEEEEKSGENCRQGAAVRGRSGSKAGENESAKETLCCKSGLGSGVR